MRRKLKLFTVVVGDVIHSRNISDRKMLSRTIPSVIRRIVDAYQDEFYAPLVLTRGIDEISGVLRNPGGSYKICKCLNEMIYPESVRFAVVAGIIDVMVASKDARKMDGPAFHKAADIIEQARRKNMRYCFGVGPVETNSLLNELTNLIEVLRSGWSKHQRSVVQLYEKLGIQQAAAKILGVTQQAISDALKQAHWDEVKRAEDAINRALAAFVNKPNGLYYLKQGN